MSADSIIQLRAIFDPYFSKASERPYVGGRSRSGSGGARFHKKEVLMATQTLATTAQLLAHLQTARDKLAAYIAEHAEQFEPKNLSGNRRRFWKIDAQVNIPLSDQPEGDQMVMFFSQSGFVEKQENIPANENDPLAAYLAEERIAIGLRCDFADEKHPPNWGRKSTLSLESDSLKDMLAGDFALSSPDYAAHLKTEICKAGGDLAITKKIDTIISHHTHG